MCLYWLKESCLETNERLSHATQQRNDRNDRVRRRKEVNDQFLVSFLRVKSPRNQREQCNGEDKITAFMGCRVEMLRFLFFFFVLPRCEMTECRREKRRQCQFNSFPKKWYVNKISLKILMLEKLPWNLRLNLFQLKAEEIQVLWSSVDWSGQKSWDIEGLCFNFDSLKARGRLNVSI